MTYVIHNFYENSMSGANSYVKVMSDEEFEKGAWKDVVRDVVHGQFARVELSMREEITAMIIKAIDSNEGLTYIADYVKDEGVISELDVTIEGDKDTIHIRANLYDDEDLYRLSFHKINLLKDRWSVL